MPYLLPYKRPRPLTDRILRVAIKILSSLHAWCLSELSEPMWRSADGRVTPLREMTERHLLACIRMLQRNGDQPVRLLQLMREAQSRGLRVR